MPVCKQLLCPHNNYEGRPKSRKGLRLSKTNSDNSWVLRRRCPRRDWLQPRLPSALLARPAGPGSQRPLERDGPGPEPHGLSPQPRRRPVRSARLAEPDSPRWPGLAGRRSRRPGRSTFKLPAGSCIQPPSLAPGLGSESCQAQYRANTSRDGQAFDGCKQRSEPRRQVSLRLPRVAVARLGSRQSGNTHGHFGSKPPELTVSQP